jgi:hypothetical protein
MWVKANTSSALIENLKRGSEVRMPFARDVYEHNLRVFPALVVDSVLEAALLVFAFQRLHFQHLGLIKQLMMEAKDLLILSIGRFWCGRGRHV